MGSLKARQSLKAHDMSGTAEVSQLLMWPYRSSAPDGSVHHASVAVLKSASVRASLRSPAPGVGAPLPSLSTMLTAPTLRPGEEREGRHHRGGGAGEHGFTGQLLDSLWWRFAVAVVEGVAGEVKGWVGRKLARLGSAR